MVRSFPAFTRRAHIGSFRMEACQIEDKKADAIINDIRGLLKSFKIKTYNEDTGYGLLRQCADPPRIYHR